MSAPPTVTPLVQAAVPPNWHVGGSFVIFLLAAVAGIAACLYMRVTAPAYFKQADPDQVHPHPGPRRELTGSAAADASTTARSDI